MLIDELQSAAHKSNIQEWKYVTAPPAILSPSPYSVVAAAVVIIAAAVASIIPVVVSIGVCVVFDASHGHPPKYTPGALYHQANCWHTAPQAPREILVQLIHPQLHQERMSGRF